MILLHFVLLLLKKTKKKKKKGEKLGGRVTIRFFACFLCFWG